MVQENYLIIYCNVKLSSAVANVCRAKQISIKILIIYVAAFCEY